MPNYVWRAKDNSGKPVVREIPATDAEQAKAILVAEGCTDLKLVAGEIEAAVMAGMPRTIKVFGEEVTITAEDLEKQRGKSPATFWRKVRESVAQSKGLTLIVIITTGFGLYRENLVLSIIMPLLLVAWIGFFVWLGLPAIYHRKIHEADDWNRWREVLALVHRLRRLSRIHTIKISETSLIRYRAKALAGLGELSKALEEFKVCEGKPDCPGWLYKAFVASIYDVAHQHDDALEWTRLSLAENQRPTIYLDYAYRLLRYAKDPTTARAALEEAAKTTLVESVKPHLRSAQGVLAYLENNLPKAKAELEAALSMAEQTPHQPYHDGFVSVTNSYLACVLAKQGSLQEARKRFHLAAPYLIATNDEMLTECRALGLQ